MNSGLKGVKCKMKTIYSIQFHIKYELAKLTLIILLSIFYCPIYDLLENSLCNTFDSDNLLYINRILFIVLIFGLIVLVSARFANFSSQNDESLILLGIGLSHKGIHANHFNMFGDFIHKLSKYPLYSKNYFGMYQHKDYLLWKLFSSILLIISCFTVNNNLVIFLIVYGICLITSFYYKDIYNFEQNLLFIYFMSNYPYRKLMSDFMISGLFILGDNILLILLIRCIVSPTTILVLVATGAMVVFISLFVNSCLFVKYPTKKSYINILLILIKLHLPILNLLFLYKNSKTGKQNWENLIYEHIQ